MRRRACSCKAARSGHFPAVVLGLGIGLSGVFGPLPAALDEYRPDEWLVSVEALIDDDERRAFLRLTRDYERRAFVDAFWQARPAVAGRPARLVWESRVEAARRQFGGIEGERARLMLAAGMPRQILPVDCPQLLRPLQLWQYGPVGANDPAEVVVFVRTARGGAERFRPWRPSRGLEELLTWSRAVELPPEQMIGAIEEECAVGPEGRVLLEAAVEPERLAAAEPISPPAAGWLERFAAQSTEPRLSDAELPEAPRVILGPAVEHGRIVEIALDLPPATESTTPPERYRLLGRVVREGLPIESFGYGYGVPAAGSRRVAFERHLQPGRYLIALRLEAVESGRAFGAEQEVEVGPPAEPWTAPPAVRLSNLPDGPLVDRVRLEVEVDAPGLERLELVLDGRPVLSRRTPPYAAELDLGPAVLIHRLEAVARDPSGAEIARDSALINASPMRTDLVVEIGPSAATPALDRTTIEVRGPAARRLERVELSADQQQLAIVDQPPFVLLVERDWIPADASQLEARAYFDDGWQAEASAVVAPSAELEPAQIAVELRDARGDLVEGVARDELAISVDRRELAVSRVDAAATRPLSVAFVIDPEALPRLDAGAWERGGATFDEILEGCTRMVLVTARGGEPRRVEGAAAGLARVPDQSPGRQALGGGAAETLDFGPSLPLALTRLAGLAGQRAAVVVASGERGPMRLDAAATETLARQAGVAIFVLAVEVGGDSGPRGALARLVEPTGGAYYPVADARALDHALADIARRLRSRHLVSFAAPPGWSEHLSVRALRGGHSIVVTRRGGP